MRRGSQTPRFGNWPDHVTSAADEAIDLAAAAGLILDPWQRLVLEHAMGERSDGRWSAFEVGLIVPRQNGKGAIIEAAILHDMFVGEPRMIVYSAHEFKAAVLIFNRIKQLILNTPELDRRVADIKGSHGEEGIILRDGTELRFFARSRGSGRAFSGDKLYLDEAFKLDSSSMAAQLPILSSRPNPQVWYVSSGGLHDSTQLAAVRDRGRAGGDDGLAYFEWSCPGDVDLSDPDALAMSNPALGIRLTEEYCRKERRAFNDDAAWGLERLGIWEDAGTAGIVDTRAWAALADPPEVDEHGLDVPGTGSHPAPSSTLTYGIAVALDRTTACIGAAGAREDDLAHVELRDYRRGTGWVVARCVEIDQARGGDVQFGIDAGGPAASLIPDLEDEGLDLVKLSARDYTKACARVYDAIAEGRLRHRGDQVLTTAVLGAGRRTLGESGWAWARRHATVDVVPVEAVTVAVWAADVGEDLGEFDPSSSIF